MRRLLAPAVLVLGLLAACGQSDDAEQPAEVGGLPATVEGPGVFEVGADLAPGAYVADVESEFSCLALSAATADIDLESDTTDQVLAPAMFLDGQLRIDLDQGTFLHVSDCDARWTRLADDEATATDPATVEGACAVLTEDLLDQVLSFPDERDPREDAELRQSLQSTLFAVVMAGLEDETPLGNAAGQLVDYLDDPAAYVTDGRLSEDVADAVEVVRSTCDH